jgi:hypothetical protein
VKVILLSAIYVIDTSMQYKFMFVVNHKKWQRTIHLKIQLQTATMSEIVRQNTQEHQGTNQYCLFIYDAVSSGINSTDTV